MRIERITVGCFGCKVERTGTKAEARSWLDAHDHCGETPWQTEARKLVELVAQYEDEHPGWDERKAPCFHEALRMMQAALTERTNR